MIGNTSTRARHFTFALLLAASATLAACNGGASSPSGPTPGGGSGGGTGSGPAPGTQTPSSPAGVYRLVSVNGAPVPGAFDSFSPTKGVLMQMVAVRGQITLNADGTYLHDYETRLTGNNMPNDVVRVYQTVGTFSGDVGALTLTPYQGTSYSPSFRTGEIVITTEAPALDGGTTYFNWSYRR